MKLHLPPCLLRRLLQRGEEAIGSTVCIIACTAMLSLASLPAILTWTGCLDELREDSPSQQAASRQPGEQSGIAEAGLSAPQELGAEDSARTLAYTTLTDMVETDAGLISSPGSIGVGGTTAYGPGGKVRSHTPSLYIMAGTMPLMNYVAHGGGMTCGSASGDDSATPSSPSTSVSPTNSPAPAPLVASAMMRSGMLRSVAASYALAAADVDAPLVETDTGFTWLGDVTDAWNTTSRNWMSEDGNRSAFTSGSSVTFGDSGSNRDINVATAQTVTDMTITGGGYSFSGGGNITISDTLYIAASGNTTFGSANNISANNATLASASNSTTTFGSAVSISSTLTITNSYSAADAGLLPGYYVFNDSLTVGGAATITLGTSGTGAYQEEHLTVEGNMSAASLTLGGAAMKTFNGSVTTTSGDLTITGSAADVRNGLTTFTGEVTIAGDLVIKDNGAAYFSNNANLTLASGSNIRMGAGTFTFNKFTQNAFFNFGTIYLTADGASLNLGSLTRGTATISSAGSTAHDFTFGDSAREFTATLSNISNLNAKGGVITLNNSSGQIHGDLNVSGGASVTLGSNTIFAADATGNISANNGTILLGSTSQTLYGDISLNKGIISGSDSSTVTATEPVSLSYTNTGNLFAANLAAGSHAVTISAVPEASKTNAADTYLNLSGDISGSGTLTFTGSGTTSIDTALSHSGAVAVENGTTLVLTSGDALAAASGVTVGNGASLSIFHGGDSTVLNGADGILLKSGATIDFTDLSGYGDIPALTLKGALLFEGDVTFNFHESDSSKKLENLHTYILATSEKSINQAAGTTAGSVRVTANGNTDALPSSQYEFGFYTVDGATASDPDVRYFTITMLVGRSWDGGQEGYWLKQDTSGEYVNWTAGTVGDTALFRTQSGFTGDVLIHLDNSTAAKSFYMDGTTNYTIKGEGDVATGKVEAFGATADTGSETLFIKKGSASMTFSALNGALDKMEIHAGALKLTNGTDLTINNNLTVEHISYDSNGNALTNGQLAIDSGSTFRQGEGSITAASTNTPATLHGVCVEGGTISGANYAEHTISNAALDNFTMNNTTLAGTGTMSNMTINEGVTIASGASYTMGGNMAILSTITNNGTVVVTSNSLIGVGRLPDYVESSSTTNGTTTYTTTYTPFSGGSYSGWDSKTLSAANFRIRGTNLDRINDITVTINAQGQVQVSSSKVKFIRWDSAFNEDSWVTPTVGLIASPSTSLLADYTVGASSDFQYSKRVSGGDTNTYVANVLAGSGNAGYTLIGGNAAIASASTQETPIHLWMNDEGSGFGKYVGGVGVYNANGGTWYGDSHLQLSRTSTSRVNVFGGSQNTIQIGNSYLTINAGTYNNVAAGSLYQDYGTVDASRHEGNSNVHITAGTITNVYGGSYKTYTKGNTYVLVDGGTITNIYGSDYVESASTHTGNVVIDLKGGSLTTVTAGGQASGYSASTSVTGNATINLYAGGTGASMLSSFAEGGSLLGSNGRVSGTSTLNMATAGTYNLTNVTINNFDVLNMAQGAEVSASLSSFNSSNDITVSGPGTLTLTGSSKTNDIYLTGGATVRLNVQSYSGYTANPTNYPSIYVAAGSRVDVTGFPKDSTNDLAVHLYLEGDGTDGLGALYKANTTTDGSINSKVSLANITLTGHASVGNGWGTGDSGIYMIAYQDKAFDALLDLSNSDSSKRGYIFTKQGSDIFGMHNTEVMGNGTINVVGGTLFTNFSSLAANTDLILHKDTTLLFGGNKGNVPSDPDSSSTETASHNGFAVETISGEGTVDLGTVGWLYLSMDQGFTSFTADFGTKAMEGQLFYNDKGYEYAVYSGNITGSGTITKRGAGTQTFASSTSDYVGGTTVEGGILYLTGTTNASNFAKAEFNSNKLTATTTVSSGVIGKGQLHWAGGAVYLGDGVRIFNASDETATTTNTSAIILGVDAIAQKDGSLYYNEATYSGVLVGRYGMVKEGLGTLNVDQKGYFDNGTTIKAGTLNLYGWASASDASLTQMSGSTLMFSYDGSYEGEGSTEVVGSGTSFVISGTGDDRWKTDTRTGEEALTAALISNVAKDKTLEIEGVISDGTSESGNVLHSGDGTFILSGTNTYSGGTTVSHGKVVVENNSGLGATASGGTANLVTLAETRVQIADGVETTLAATQKDVTVNEDTTTHYAGNDIRGTISIGTGATSAAAAQLNMTGSGYYAERTELEANATLVFSGTEASNWDGVANTAGKTSMAGAGALAGNGTVAVSNAAAHYDKDESKQIEGTTVYFQVTDSLHSTDAGFAGNMVVEGDNTTLHIQGGQLDGGNYDVSGNGARLDAKRSAITVQDGKHIALRSMGDAGTDKYSAAVLAAHSVEVEKGGVLSAYQSATSFEYNEAALLEATQLDMESAMHSYYATDWKYHFANEKAEQQGYTQFFVNTAALVNDQTVATLETVDGLTMHGGSIYDVYDTNVSLAGTQLTFNVTTNDKIILSGGEAFEKYIAALAAAKDSTSATDQWVLFSNVGAFNAIMNSQTLVEAQSLTSRSTTNQIYVASANDFVVARNADGTSYTDLADNILLVYDAGAQVLYLDRNPNVYPEPTYKPEVIPEPTTATLSLLALTALAARRRRK